LDLNLLLNFNRTKSASRSLRSTSLSSNHRVHPKKSPPQSVI